jgi:hypothetical protein
MSEEVHALVILPTARGIASRLTPTAASGAGAFVRNPWAVRMMPVLEAREAALGSRAHGCFFWSRAPLRRFMPYSRAN